MYSITKIIKYIHCWVLLNDNNAVAFSSVYIWIWSREGRMPGESADAQPTAGGSHRPRGWGQERYKSNLVMTRSTVLKCSERN